MWKCFQYRVGHLHITELSDQIYFSFGLLRVVKNVFSFLKLTTGAKGLRNKWEEKWRPLVAVLAFSRDFSLFLEAQLLQWHDHLFKNSQTYTHTLHITDHSTDPVWAFLATIHSGKKKIPLNGDCINTWPNTCPWAVYNDVRVLWILFLVKCISQELFCSHAFH